MNRNRKVRLAATILTAGLTITSTGLTAFANPIAGATAMLSTDVSITQTANSYTTLSGINLAMANMLSSANAAANAPTETEEKETDVVATSSRPVNDYSNIAIAKVNDFVNVRAHASEDSEVVGKLYSNGAGTVLKKKGSWVKIESGSVVGYVKSKYVVIGDEKAVKKASRRVAKVKADTLYVREKATKKADIIGMVPRDEDLTVTSEKKFDDGWVKVSVEEGDGYVSTKYVDLSTEYTYAESKAEEQARLAAEAAARAEAERAAAAAAAAQAQRAAATSSTPQAAPSGGANTQQPSYTAPSGGSGSSVVNYASQFVGNPYVYGGSSLTNGTDCSGFVMSVYSAFGVSLPHSSSGDRSVGYAVSTSDMQPGDIVCYSGHVAIYAGNGTIVHASNPRTGITYGNVNYRQILAVRRVL
ncbi:MAG: C40 family peptidase [Lachnospiraceae bacterium]|nr:C40 family peptidase [Lachnospiraceae bacterium]